MGKGMKLMNAVASAMGRSTDKLAPKTPMVAAAEKNPDAASPNDSSFDASGLEGKVCKSCHAKITHAMHPSSTPFHGEE